MKTRLSKKVDLFEPFTLEIDVESKEELEDLLDDFEDFGVASTNSKWNDVEDKLKEELSRIEHLEE